MHHQQQGLSASAASPSSNHMAISPCGQSGVEEGDSRSDGEGEEGESEGVIINSRVEGAPRSPTVDPSPVTTPTAHDVEGNGESS